MLILIRGFIDFSIYESIKKIFEYINKYKTSKSIQIKNDELHITKDLINQEQENNTEIDNQEIEEEIIKEEHLEIPKDDADASNEIIIEEQDLIDESSIDDINKVAYDNYKLPSSNLLNEPLEIINESSEEDLKNRLLNLFTHLKLSMQGQVIRISPGPVITLFEIEPAEGVRVNKFTTLSDDLARVMQASSIRVIAPIPGSRSVGIELPNKNPQTVYLKTILNSEKYVNSSSKLTIAVGKTTTGDAFVFDLGSLPHLLIAGATGAGKSVCINTIIMSILYKAKPDEVKFVLIDPKKLELSIYKQLVGYHLITSSNLDEYVMTTAENAVGILDASINEMERRFSLFAESNVRNIGEYHTKYKNDTSMEKIPYLVVLIDELADLMMTASRAVEDPITRFLKSKSSWNYLVVATQRPSVDVITGLIKSNFPN